MCACSYLQPDNDSIEVQHRLPVLAQNVQAHLALEVDVGVVYLLSAEHLGGLVRKVLVDGKVKGESAAAVHALVGLDGKDKVEDVVGVWEVGLHRGAERQF